MNKSILVTGIGGNVGQGILRIIREYFKNINVIGTNVEHVSAGNYLCDIIEKVPFAYEKDYIRRIQEICRENKIDLIIPSTDYEVYYLAKHRAELPILACNPENTASIFLDKFKTFEHFSKYDIPFAKSVLPSKYDGGFSNIIVKPRKGRGSRNIYIDPNPKEFDDNDYMVQEMHHGTEITSTFYVTKEKKILGPITFIRSMENGTTIKCLITDKYNDELHRIMSLINQNIDIKGSCNIQSIVDDNNQVYPFEINGRISGTNSVRSQFGFNDVKFTIDEYLFNKKLDFQPQIKKGAALRILMDIIYPEVEIESQLQNPKTPNYMF